MRYICWCRVRESVIQRDRVAKRDRKFLARLVFQWHLPADLQSFILRMRRMIISLVGAIEFILGNMMYGNGREYGSKETGTYV